MWYKTVVAARGLPGVVVLHLASLKADQRGSALVPDLAFLPKMVEGLVTAPTKRNPVLDPLARSTTVQLISSGRAGPRGALVRPLEARLYPGLQVSPCYLTTLTAFAVSIGSQGLEQHRHC